MENVDRGWGSFLKFRLLTETRAFDRVENALKNSGIEEYHPGVVLLERPSAQKAFTRAMNYLMRACNASIPFCEGSKHATWLENGQTVTGPRNPNYSLKIEAIKGSEHSAFRFNISNRANRAENMAHVLTVVFVPGEPINIVPGEPKTWENFGPDVADIINNAYTQYFTNYDDSDLRHIIKLELNDMRAVNVLGRTANFLSVSHTERAQKLMQFLIDCGHEATILGLDHSGNTRDALLGELSSSIMSELNEYEDVLNSKLNPPTRERARGEKQRMRMKATADAKLDDILGMAKYYADIFGVMAEGIEGRIASLRDKASEFLTKDFGSATPQVKAVSSSSLEQRIRELTQENARLRANQGLKLVPHEAKVELDADMPVAVADPFA